MSPAIDPEGVRSHRRISQPRAGSAASYVAASRATRRRDVAESPTTRRRATPRHSQPRSAASCSASRVLRSKPWSVAWESGTTDLTSTTSTIPVARWNAKMSIEPRSPQTEKDASTATSQPDARRRTTNASTSRACASSSSRSIPSPRHRSLTSTVAPSEFATARRRPTVTLSISRSRSCPPTIETTARHARCLAAASRA